MDKRILVLILIACFLSSFIPQGLSETGDNDETLRERYARLIWANMTAAQVNSTFPFTFVGTSSNGTACHAEYFGGALLYFQTENVSYLSKGEELADWLISTDVKNLFFIYDTSTGWQNAQLASSAVLKLAELAVFVRAVPSYASLLQSATSKYISLFVNASTYRHFDRVDYDGQVFADEATSSAASLSVRALAMASDILGNDTVRDVAYRMIMNWTIGTANLPYAQIEQDGTAYGGSGHLCKQDQTFGYYILGLSSYNYYFPNETVKELINNVTMSFYDKGWNGGASRWNYQTNADSGVASNTIGVHGFGFTDEAFLQAYLVWGNATWLGRMKQDMLTMINDAGLMENGLITHTTDPISVDADEMWNVAARRTFNLFYNFNYTGFYRNATFLDYANDQFVNATLAHNRTQGWQQKVNATDFTDTAPSNFRMPYQAFLSYVNRTTATIETLDDLHQYFGEWLMGLTDGMYSYNFYGVYDEDTGDLNSPNERAANVTIHFSYAYSITFELNGSYYFRPATIPLYFSFNLTNTREYWLSEDETSGDYYIYDTTTTVYTISFLDLAGALDDYPFVTIRRGIDGTLRTVEKRKVDVEKKVQASLKQGERYTITIENGATYVYGELLVTSQTTIVLTLKGIEFPKETLLTSKYVRIYALEGYTLSYRWIQITYEDTLSMTTSVGISIKYKNGSTAYSTTLYSDSFVHTWSGALNDTDYILTAHIVHERYGSYSFRQYFSRYLSANPWGLDWLGTNLPFDTSLIIPFFLILFVGGCFSVINAEVGAFLMVITAIIVCYMWALPIPAATLIVAFTLAILMGLIYAKRRVMT